MKIPRWFIAVTLLLVSTSALCQAPLVSQEKLSECAHSAVEFAMRVHKVDLNYSPRSLGYVDGMMSDFYSRKLPFAKVENHVRVMGCYAGEVFLRNLNGKWIYPKTEDVEKLGPGPFMELPNGVVINPLVKVQSIYEEGLQHSIVKFYALVEATVRAKQESTKQANPSSLP